MSVETMTPPPSNTALALVAQPALAPRKRGWPTPGAIVGMLWLGALTFSAVFADYLPFIRHFEQEVLVNGEVANQYGLGPGWTAWFGTDRLGRDVFAKCVYGARTTLFIGVVATIIGLVFGGLTGIVAGYRRGKTDRVLGHLHRLTAGDAGDHPGRRDDLQARRHQGRPVLARLGRPPLADHVDARDHRHRPAVAHRAGRKR